MKARQWLLRAGVALMLVGLVLPASLVQANGVTVTLDAPTQVRGTTDFIARLNISYVVNFDACALRVRFDPAVLSLTGVTDGNIGGTTIPVAAVAEKEPGLWGVVANVPGFPGVTGEGYLMEFHFHAADIGAATDTDIILEHYSLSNNDAQAIPATWVGDTVHVFPSDELAIDHQPASFSFTATIGGMNPADQTLDIWNSTPAAGAMTWEVADDAAWLSLDPTSDTSTGEHDVVTLSVDISGMAQGSYSATITITADAANTPQLVPVTLTIFDSTERVLDFQPQSFSFYAAIGGTNPAIRTLDIWNSNPAAGAMTWGVSDDAAWLTLNPTSGSSTDEHDVVTLSVDISGMAQGSYNGTITITADAANTPQLVPVTLTIFDATERVLDFQPQSFSFYAAIGTNPADQTLDIWNSNPAAGAMTWGVSDDAAWLTLNPTSGSSTGEHDVVTLSVDISGMAQGSYSGTITITADAANTPQLVPVTLTIFDSTERVLDFQPQSFSFYAAIGGMNPADQTLDIWNSTPAAGAMTWGVSDDAAWLSLNPTSGSSTGEHDVVTLSVYISGMAAGDYSGTITITADAANTPQLVPVTLKIAFIGGGGGGGGAPGGISKLTVNLLGSVSSSPIFGNCRLSNTITITSPDGNLTITIPNSTCVLDKEGNPLPSLQVTIDENPPPPPENANIIGLACNFEPDGVTFDSPITLTWRYDPSALPEGVAEEDLVLAYYDEEAGRWVELDCTVDTTGNAITASLSHFTTFAIIASALPPAPAAFSLSNLTVQPAEVQSKEAVTISVAVANTGGTQGSYTVVLKINGVKEAEKSVTIAAGGSETVTFSVTKEDSASYSVTVDGLSGSFTVIAVIAPPAPAAFAVSSLSIQPIEVQTGEAVTISVAVANTGGTEGSYTVVLKINGVKEAETSVTIAAGGSETVTFSVTKEDAARYGVTVDGLSGSFTVVAPAVVINNWPLLGGIIAGVVVAALHIIFLARAEERRRLVRVR